MTDISNINLNGTAYPLAAGISDIGENVKNESKPYYEPYASTGNAWFGILIKVKAGDVVSINRSTFASVALSRPPIQIYDFYPEGNSHEQPGSSHILYSYSEATEDGLYEVPSNLTTAKAMFFQVRYGSISQYAPNGVYDNSAHYVAWIVGSPQDGIAPYYLLSQKNGYVIDDDCRDTMFYSLVGGACHLVNKRVLVLGDSITETVAKTDTNGNAQQGDKPYYGNGFITRIIRKYNMSSEIHGESSSRWFPTSGKNSCVNMVTNVCFPSDPNDEKPADYYDYIIIEYGTNDILFRPTGYGSISDTASSDLNCSTVSAIRYCIESLQATFPYAKILIVHPFMRGSAERQTDQSNYIALADQVFDEYGVKRVYPRTQAGITASMLSTDGIHLHKKDDADDQDLLDEGVKRLSECIEGALLTM